MANIIDSLFLELGITGNFGKDAEKAISVTEDLKKTFGETEKATGKSEKALKVIDKELAKSEKQTKKNVKQAKDFGEAIKSLGKTIGALGAIVAAGTGLDSFAKDAAKLNISLDNLAKNVGTSRNALSNWSGAAELAGGSADGMLGTVKNLSSGLARFAVMGDDSILKFFSALNIMPMEVSGKMKDVNDLLFEMADKFSAMDRVKGFTLAQSMGIDEDTFNMLARGRNEVQELLDQQSKLYRSRQKDVETSYKLTKSTNMINQQFQAMKLMIGNAAAPALLKISEIVEKFFNFLMEHEGLVQGFFIGLSGVLTAFLIPTLVKAAAAAVAFIAPFLPAILVVGGLAAAIGLLYDDYKTWAEGGDSLFKWGKFIKYFTDTEFSVENLKNAFADLVTGYKSWDEAVAAGKAWFEQKGFIKDGKVTVESLATGFKNLAKDIYEDALPALRRFGEIIEALLEGDFSKAIELVGLSADDVQKFAKDKGGIFGNMASGGIEFGKGIFNAGSLLLDGEFNKALDTLSNSGEKAAVDIGKAIDAATDNAIRFFDIYSGHDPDSEASLTQMKKTGAIYNTEGAIGIPRVDENGNIINRQSTLTGSAEMLAQAISHGEGGYSSVNRGLVNGVNLGSYEEDLSKLTVDEILARNKLPTDDPRRMNAVGRYQIINSTLRDLKKNMGLSGNELFTPELQDKMFLELLPKSAKGYINGKHNDKISAMTDVSKVWASVGVPVAMQGKHRMVQPGESYYAGDGGNKANAKSIQLVSSALDHNRNNQGYKLDLNQPIGGYAVANAVQSTETARNTMMSYAQPQNITNNQRTEVVINGGVNVQSSANTIAGTTADAALGIQQRFNVFAYNNGIG